MIFNFRKKYIVSLDFRMEVSYDMNRYTRTVIPMNKKNIISIILIITGAIVFSYPFVARGYTNYQQNQLAEDYEQILLENKQELDNNNITGVVKQDVDNQSIDEVEPTLDSPEKYVEEYVNMEKLLPFLMQAAKDSQNSDEKAKDVNDYLSRQDILGMIEIEKIKLKNIVVEGTEKENIRVTIGHMSQTAPMGGDGNCALAGHRGGTYGIFFKNIDQLEIDDEIKITDIKGEAYIYKVYNKFVTEATDMAVIDDVPGEKTLTLISCEENGTKRLIIHARID